MQSLVEPDGVIMQLHLNSQTRGNERNYSGEPRNIQGGTLKRNPSGPWLVGSTQNIHVFPWIWEPVMEMFVEWFA